MTTDALNIPAILQEVRGKRFGENVTNVFKLICVLCLAMLAAGITMILVAPDRLGELTAFIGMSLLILFWATIVFVFQCLFLFWPFILYFWGSIQTVRQRMFLTLVQNAIESGKPLQDIVRVHAASCYSRYYASRLRRFADALDAGQPLETAVHHHWGLFRYDVAGMIRLGGNNPETIRSIERLAQDEKTFSPQGTMTLLRVVYLCTIALWILNMITFFLLNVLPTFVEMFEDFEISLPTFTLIIIAASEAFAHYWYLLSPLMIVFALFVVFYLIIQTQIVTFRPIGLRRMFRNTDAARFMKIFSIGIRLGYPIPAIMQMYRWTVPSNYLRRKGVDIQHAVEQGGSWIDAVCRAGFVSQPEAALLYCAERTGNTAMVLEQLAQSKERTQFRKDELFSKMAFIPLIFLFAIIIGAFVIGMFMPMVEMISALA